jgi:hypothetical protein
MATAKPKKFAMTKAKVNKQNTRHGKMDMPFKPLNKKAGYAAGGEVSFKEAFAAARKAQGAGGRFTWKGKEYTTDRADDKKPSSTPPNRMKLDTSEKAVTVAARETLKPTPKAPPNALARKRAPAGIAKEGAADTRVSSLVSTLKSPDAAKPKTYRELSPGERMGKLAPSAPGREREQRTANKAREKAGLPTRVVGPGWAKGGVVRGGGIARKGIGKGKMC